MRKIFLNFCLVLLALPQIQQAAQEEKQTHTLSSPNKHIELQISKDAQHPFCMEAAYVNNKRHAILSIPSIGIQLEDGSGKKLKLKKISKAYPIHEHYTMITGKRKEIHNEANEYTCHFTDTLQQELILRIRLYNDGITFRYEGKTKHPARLLDEQTTYRIPEGTKRWMQTFNASYEDFYPLTTTGKSENRHWGYPALIQTDNEVWTLISEAGIEQGQSASTLKNEQKISDYKVCPALNKKTFSNNWATPWRVMIIGSLSDIVESTLVTDVSRPTSFKDTNWLHPGSVSWIYWAYNHGSKDYAIVKQYIDMAAQLKLPYVLIDWEWDVMGNGGTLEDALRYAHQKGVRVLLWYNSSTAWVTNGASGPLYKLNKPEDREREFTWLEQQGVAGVKIDFFDGDTEETMDYCIELLECAARHHLLVNLHGATIPRGWQRTYPNLMSVEAVYGAEWYNNLPTLTNKAAAHNATLPFTRNVIGPMDYTPCTFSDSQHPHITTHAQELALAVLFESALQHWADKPESYLAQPEKVKSFMGKLPTAWDNTRLLSGYPGNHVIMARQKGDTWYIGGINGKDEEQMLNIDWSFLGKGKYKITLFEDNKDDSDPWKITTSTGTLSQMPTKLNCHARGGFVAAVEKLKLVQ